MRPQGRPVNPRPFGGRPALVACGLVPGTPMLVELGVLLDLLVAVFVMGITIFHINREFEHIDTDRLTTLTDWRG